MQIQQLLSATRNCEDVLTFLKEFEGFLRHDVPRSDQEEFALENAVLLHHAMRALRKANPFKYDTDRGFFNRDSHNLADMIDKHLSGEIIGTDNINK